GLKYILLDLATAKIFIFINSLFANNTNLLLQIKFVILLANKKVNNNNRIFKINSNIIYFSSTKLNILASEVYSIITSANIVVTILSTIRIITRKLGIPLTLTIIYTNLYSLYKYLVKLGIT
ncbi:hypothetical protein CH063_15442, partial [Colletotrichum higginsianum]